MRFSFTFAMQSAFALAVAIGSWITRGVPGLWGALLGILMVVLFFGSTKFILGPIVAMSPAMSQSLALLFFFTKAAALAAVLIVMSKSDSTADVVDFSCLAAALIGGSLVWIAGQTIDHARARIPTYDLPQSDE